MRLRWGERERERERETQRRAEDAALETCVWVQRRQRKGKQVMRRSFGETTRLAVSRAFARREDEERERGREEKGGGGGGGAV